MSIAVYRYSQFFEVNGFSGHDEQKGDFQVDKPTRFWRGSAKATHLLPMNARL